MEVGAAFAVLVLSLGPGCGSRTALRTAEPCGQDGAMRDCRDACGDGVQTCRDGFWDECAVERVVEVCENICGTGTRVCEGGVRGECAVARVERTCSNECGAGTELCGDGVLGPCEVPDATRPCSNECGTGIEHCEGGRWLGVCQVPVAARRCSNDCGNGTEECREGSWTGACVTPEVTRPCETVCGVGEETCELGSWGRCDAPRPRPPLLVGVARDFHRSHPDFEIDFADLDLGIVERVLGPDDKPVYAGDPTTPSTSGAMNFDQWYRDVDGVNLSAEVEIQFEESPDVDGLFVYENRSFFPLDAELFGNEGLSHNYHFTLEVSTDFNYIGGEVFSFSGDDDLWVFINRRLALDIGGVHVTQSGVVVLDEQARDLRIEVGKRYSLHLFFAERHTVQSTFVVRTTIADGFSCP